MSVTEPSGVKGMPSRPRDRSRSKAIWRTFPRRSRR